jgi:hypothetical protein
LRSDPRADARVTVEERPMADAAVWGTVLTVLAVCAVVGVAVTLVVDDRDPSIVLAWLLMILLVPVLGVVSYFFVGRNYRRAARRRNGAVRWAPLLPAGTPATAGPAALPAVVSAVVRAG